MKPEVISERRVEERRSVEWMKGETDTMLMNKRDESKGDCERDNDGVRK